MSGKTNLAELVNKLTPKLNEGEYVFATVTDLKKISREDTICEFKEQEGVTIVLEKTKADDLGLSYEYIAAWITLKVHSSLEAVGLTALFSNELSINNISCNVIAGYYHDHIFVNINDGVEALRLLKHLSKNYR